MALMERLSGNKETNNKEGYGGKSPLEQATDNQIFVRVYILIQSVNKHINYQVAHDALGSQN